MSMPRRAMKEMGFQACCLLCDAPDEKGVKRCGSCIDHHRRVRDEIAKAPAEDSLYQFAKEILMMAAAPHRYDHDETHGPALLHQQHLAAALTERTPLPSGEDVADVFDKLRAKKSFQPEGSGNDLVRDLVNEVMFIDEVQLEQYGARTVPSQAIEEVDRRDRLGEDTELTDRLEAAKQAQSAPKNLVEETEELVFEQRQKEREMWKSTLSDVKELLEEKEDV